MASFLNCCFPKLVFKIMTFLSIRFLDILDIFLVAYLLYQVYMLLKGTVAMNIFVGVFGTYLLWLLVKALNMQLLGSILGQVMGVGMVAIVVVFQQEIRRFFLLIGTRYLANRNFSIEKFLSLFIKKDTPEVKIYQIVKACVTMARSKTGALIVVTDKSDLKSYSETGEILDAITSQRTIETVFFKNSPLHDGAMIIYGDKIYAAGCVLPVSENPKIPQHLGLRHRAAVGMTEATDSFVLIVSEETGYISYAQNGKVVTHVSPTELSIKMKTIFSKKLKEEKVKK